MTTISIILFLIGLIPMVFFSDWLLEQKKYVIAIPVISMVASVVITWLDIFITVINFVIKLIS